MSYPLPNMGLTGISIGTDTGTTIETNINSNTTIIDSHNHTNGQGVQIPSQGILIASALPFNNQQATNMGAVIFTNQTSLATLNALYTIGGELWFNDTTQAIQITAGGAVNATSSGISSGTATAAFSSSVLVVNEATNTPASIKVGSVLVGATGTSGSNYVTIAPPASISSGGWNLTLPAIPGSQSFVTLDSSGNFGTPAVYPLTGASIAATTVTRSNQVAVGQQISASCGFYHSTTGGGAVTNMSVTITTSGRPVMLSIQNDGSGNQSYISTTGNTNASIYLNFYRGATMLNNNYYTTPIGSSTAVVPANLQFMDVVGAGTYTYTFQITTSSSNLEAFYLVLVAYEL
jgi:hypothetical protein